MKRTLLTLIAAIGILPAMAQFNEQCSEAEKEFPYSIYAIEQTYDFQTKNNVRQPFSEYIKYDVDGDGMPEVMVRTSDKKYIGIYSDTQMDLYIIGWTDNEMREASFYEHAAYSAVQMGTTNNKYGIVHPVYKYEKFFFLKNSIPETILEIEENYNEKTMKTDTVYKINGKPVSAKKGKAMRAKAGKGPLDNLQWKPIPEERMSKG